MASNEPAGHPNGRSGSDRALVDGVQVDETQAAPANHRIAKNATYLTLALLVQKALTFGYFIFLNRSIDRDAFGSYFTALTIATVFGYFVDVAFSQVLIRETAKRPEQTNTYLNAAVSLKLLIAVFIYAAALLYVLIFGLPELTRSLVYLTGMIMVLDSFTLSFYSIFRGHQKLQYEAIGTVVNVLIKIVVGVAGIKLGFGVYVVVSAILVASVFNFLFSAILLTRAIGWRPHLVWDGETLKFLGRIAVPFAIAGIFQTIYNNQDQLLLANPLLVGARGQSYVAWYATAYKYTFALAIIPAAIAAAIFPAMSQFYVNNKAMLAHTFERATRYLILIGVPLMFGILTLADKIILTVSTKAFIASVIPMQILSVALFCLFLNYPVGYLLNAADRQTRNTIHIGIAMVFNLILNTLLIPHMTFVGASIASSLSSILLLALGLIVVPQIIRVDTRGLLMAFLKSIIAGLSMGILLYDLKTRFGLFPLTGLGVVWYTAALFLLRALSLDEGRRVFRALRRRLT